ncbi:hypothetical protein F5Y07DRAFT_357879 [Xylaria sp. FL0933]|nr:hypothetical protein F5Y07DRAFT_357879 [Xylaria sp. FL0933]
MGTLRSKRFLRCFYCGQRSGIRFDAQKSFRCANCEATNWLDQNGEITDPPAAPESPKPNKVQYATFRAAPSLSPPPPPTPLSPLSFSSSPPAGRPADDPVFCATCLRNQQMLSSSLAQFEWPEDPTAAENRERERKYWALKKDLETRYPQVCAVCLPKANKKLFQASYTAQTDHLRRTLDRTRLQRETPKRRGPLDLVDVLGKSVWHAGFVLQLFWHITVICLLLTEPYSSTSRDDGWIPATLGAFYRLCAAKLPSPDWLMQWAINLGMCSFPWNPRFKQSIRGFTAHILGFRQWYTYQLMALLLRTVALSIAQYSRSKGLPTSTQLVAQLIIPLFMIQLYVAAKKAIRTDTRPLFRQPAELTAGLPVPSTGGSARSNPGLGDILDDILHSPPTSAQQAVSSVSSLHSQTHGNEKKSNQASPVSRMVTNKPLQPPQERSHITNDPDEMDWSPSGSQHRAFSSYNAFKVKNTNPRFSEAPIEQKPGPIWYKVPPAPTNPAQRLRNPPMRPIIREQPKERENFFKPTGHQPVNFSSRPQEGGAELSIAPPKFHAPLPKDDPRDGLSSMFAKSFSIDPSSDEEERPDPGKSRKSSIHGQMIPNRTMARVAELAALLGALYGWIFALGSDSEQYYGRSVALASVCVCLMVSIRLAADLEVDRQIRGDTRPSLFAPSLANLALAQAVAVIIFMWHIWSKGATSELSGVYGNTLFGGVITHHVFHIFA